MLLTDLSTMKLGFAGKRAFQGPSEGLMKNTFMANPSKKPGWRRTEQRRAPAAGCHARVWNVRPLISSFNKVAPRWPWCLTVAWGSRVLNRSLAQHHYPPSLSSLFSGIKTHMLCFPFHVTIWKSVIKIKMLLNLSWWNLFHCLTDWLAEHSNGNCEIMRWGNNSTKTKTVGSVWG